MPSEAALQPPPDESGPADAPAKAELAAHVAARLCHDLISPVGAIVSGLDLMDDPEAQDMREEAMGLIAASARKLASLLSFTRVAFGASAAAESFDSAELGTLAQGVFAHVRADLDWAVGEGRLDKPAARAALNLAQMGAGALPTGGTARLTLDRSGPELVVAMDARGARARLRPEAQAGLKGLPCGEGLTGQWVQAYYLHALVTDAGGSIACLVEDEHVRIAARLPNPAA